MKTKEQILSMSKEELEAELSDVRSKIQERGSETNVHCDKCSECLDCSQCTNCVGCFFSSDCSNCYACTGASGLKYAVCNVELSEEEYKSLIN